MDRERFRKKLNKYLELAPDEGFFQLVWAANMIQAGHEQAALPFLKNVPTEAVTDDLRSDRAIPKWELETLINELLTVPKRRKPIRRLWRELDCSRYDAFVLIRNSLHGLENAEAGLRLKRMNVVDEMPRIAARQFDWQRGWLNIPQFYRSTFIYGQGECAAFFQTTHGLTVNDFSMIGFALHTAFAAYPHVSRSLELGELPVTRDALARALDLLSCPIRAAREQAVALRRPLWPVAHQPSILRQHPIVSFGETDERLRSPLPQLILERVTAGLFYDVAGAGWEVRDEYGRRFEGYSLRYCQAMLPEADWQPEQPYRLRREEYKSPDILWLADGGVRLAIECKATRMSIDARYADDPLTARGYDDIIKAVYQLWRYFSHCRRGLTGQALRADTVGMVLTLDSWLLMANDLNRKIFEAAGAMAAEKDPKILVEDRRPIIFCAITDLETTLAKADLASFAATINRAAQEDRQGWAFSIIHDEVTPGREERRPYPFKDDMARLLPWWTWVIQEREARRATNAA